MSARVDALTLIESNRVNHQLLLLQSDNDTGFSSSPFVVGQSCKCHSSRTLEISSSILLFTAADDPTKRHGFFLVPLLHLLPPLSIHACTKTAIVNCVPSLATRTRRKTPRPRRRRRRDTAHLLPINRKLILMKTKATANNKKQQTVLQRHF